MTPISIGYDAWTVPEDNQIEIKNAEISLDRNIKFITLGWQDLDRLGFFILSGDEESPRSFGFQIEELDEDDVNAEEHEGESETETEDSSDDDL